MKHNSLPPNNVTSTFVAKHSADVIGVLCGFDRLRLRGTLRALYQPTVLLRYLFVCQILLKGFKNYALGLTKRIIEHAEDMATKAGRPWRYLGSGKISKGGGGAPDPGSRPGRERVGGHFALRRALSDLRDPWSIQGSPDANPPCPDAR